MPASGHMYAHIDGHIQEMSLAANRMGGRGKETSSSQIQSKILHG